MDVSSASPSLLPRQRKSQCGASLLDHTLIVALVAIACIGSVTSLRHGVLASFCGYLVGERVAVTYSQPGSFQGGFIGHSGQSNGKQGHYYAATGHCTHFQTSVNSSIFSFPFTISNNYF